MHIFSQNSTQGPRKTKLNQLLNLNQSQMAISKPRAARISAHRFGSTTQPLQTPAVQNRAQGSEPSFGDQLGRMKQEPAQIYSDYLIKANVQKSRQSHDLHALEKKPLAQRQASS
mmetsp:Transcript_6916/g.11652  ORF Transcript_6916/g.11652 Transcript_6916/m.11652 type:complete len:115 (-) Transcript_6916:182-526(-)